MSSREVLQGFGINPGEDLSHHLMAADSQLDPSIYFDMATNLLTAIRPEISNSIADDLERYAGNWNPGGFMVFPLGLHESSGSSLRLHVYASPEPTPENAHKQPSKPKIHDHGWHLAGLAHLHEYTDTIYELRKLGGSSADQPADSLKLYRTHRMGNGQDILVLQDEAVEPVPIEERVITEGRVHTIEAGVYHIPTVDTRKRAVTLVLDSPALTSVTGVLLPRHEKEIPRTRRPLDIADVALAREVLLVA